MIKVGRGEILTTGENGKDSSEFTAKWDVYSYLKLLTASSLLKSMGISAELIQTTENGLHSVFVAPVDTNGPLLQMYQTENRSGPIRFRFLQPSGIPLAKGKIDILTMKNLLVITLSSYLDTSIPYADQKFSFQHINKNSLAIWSNPENVLNGGVTVNAVTNGLNRDHLISGLSFRFSPNSNEIGGVVEFRER